MTNTWDATSVKDARDSRGFTRALTTVVGVAGIGLGLVAYGRTRYPLSGLGGAAPFIMAGGGFLAYAIAGLFARRAAPPLRTALSVGTIAGCLLAAVGAANHIVEMTVPLSPGVSAALGAGMWGLVFLGFGVACSATFLKEDSLGLGVLSSVWCGVVYAVLLVTFALAMGLVFLLRMERVLAAEYAASGMTDPAAFVVRDHVTNASSHLLYLPGLAVVIGMVSGATSLSLASLGRRAIRVLGALGLVLFVTGGVSIGVATKLERVARPPFIVFGLVAMAVTMGSAHALWAAVRRSLAPP